VRSGVAGRVTEADSAGKIVMAVLGGIGTDDLKVARMPQRKRVIMPELEELIFRQLA
jgi:hypothetical protein